MEKVLLERKDLVRIGWMWRNMYGDSWSLWDNSFFFSVMNHFLSIKVDIPAISFHFSGTTVAQASATKNSIPPCVHYHLPTVENRKGQLVVPECTGQLAFRGKRKVEPGL